MSKKNSVIFVVGPTASGKSSWALQVAQEVGGVIFNCDSVQLYSGLSIGAAMPTPQEIQQVPHHLYSYVKAPNEMTAGEYCRDFYAEVEKIPEQTPIFVVGGTGFYFQAIEKGMYPVEKIPEEIQKNILQEFTLTDGPEKLYQELQQKDPEAAKKIHPSDHYRIGRALELIRTHDKTLSDIRQQFSEQLKVFPFPLLKTGLKWEREKLRERIQKRTEMMIESGLLSEVQSLLDQGLENWAPLSSVGYKECIEFIKNKKDVSWLQEQITIHTQQLAKRQRTWFQRDKDIQWFDAEISYDDFRKSILAFLRSNQS